MQSSARAIRHATAIVAGDAHHTGSGAIRFSPGWRPRTTVGFDVPYTVVLVRLAPGQAMTWLPDARRCHRPGYPRLYRGV